MIMHETLQYPLDAVPEKGELLSVGQGIFWLRMPLPFALDHINLWLISEPDGTLTAVDTGYGDEASRAVWARVVTRLGARIRRIVVTHCHPDHLGLARWLADQHDAEILMTQGEWLRSKALWHQVPGCRIEDMVAQYRVNGLDAARLDKLARRGNAYQRGIPVLPDHYHRLFDGQTLELGGERWQLMAGYGHSPEHASLYCHARRILISGDMLLPRISTNISVDAATPQADALGWFLDSLQQFNNLPHDTLVLPSHGRPFKGIGARVAELIAHHAGRCAVLKETCEVPRSAGEILGTLFERELDTHQVMFAMGEAIAHLNHLHAQQALCRRLDADGVIRFVRNA